MCKLFLLSLAATTCTSVNMVVGVVPDEQVAPPPNDDFVGQLVAFFNQPVDRADDTDTQPKNDAVVALEKFSPIINVYFNGIALLLTVSMLFDWRVTCDSYVRVVTTLLVFYCLGYANETFRSMLIRTGFLTEMRIMQTCMIGIAISSPVSTWYIFSFCSCTATRMALIIYSSSITSCALGVFALCSVIILNPTPSPMVTRIIDMCGLQVFVRACKPLTELLARYQIKED